MDYPSRIIINRVLNSRMNAIKERSQISSSHGVEGWVGRMLIQSPGKRADNDVGDRHYTRVTGAEICGACFINGASAVSTGVANVACVRPVE